MRQSRAERSEAASRRLPSRDRQSEATNLWSLFPHDGFTLTEVAIALGIVAFVLISLLGLMSVGMEAGKSSVEDTVIAGITKMVLTDLRTNSYTDLQSYSDSQLFDYSGKQVTTNGYFSCSVKTAAHISHPLPALAATTNVLRVTIRFTWPVGSAQSNEQIIETTIARY